MAEAKEKRAVRCLKIALTPGTEDLEKVKAELIAKNHEVTIVEGLDEYDVVLGANCHRMSSFNEKLLSLLIKSRRTLVYGARGNKRLDSKDA